MERQEQRWFVAKKQINTTTEICCGKLPHGRFKDGHELGCFQDMVFDKTLMVACGGRLEFRTSVEREYTKDFFCCFGQFHTKDNYDGCCHGDKERLYKRRLQECCNGVVVDRNIGTAQVCRGTELVDRNDGINRLRQCIGPHGQNILYDSSRYVCCTQTGMLMTKPDPGPYFCHDDGVYNSYQMQLLRLNNGTKVVVQKGIETCGNAFITTQDPFYDINCCDGIVHHVEKSKWNTMECCGTKMFNYTSQTCCNNTIYNSDTGCCNGHTPYILKAEDCCENKVIDRAKELCCRNTIVTKTHPSHYECCYINRTWTTYNELDPPDECLSKHIRNTFRISPTTPGRRSRWNQNTANETTMRIPLDECPFTECYNGKQRSACRKLYELDVYLEDVLLITNGSNLNVTIIQPDEFVNRKVTIFMPYTCPCLERGYVYTLFSSRRWVRKLTIYGDHTFANFPTINKKDFIVKRGSGETNFT
ncbi:hypothetical protein MAR_036199, partial [Mya arenaria]